MSHFSVMVITNGGGEAELHDALQPFHEYECTGVEDQYVINVDMDDDVRSQFANTTRTVWVDSEGKEHSPHDDRFFREPTEEETKQSGPFAGSGFGGGLSYISKDWGDGKGYRAKIHMSAAEAGMAVIEKPMSEVTTIEEWAEGYGGWKLDANGRFFDRTNPNKKWDWWQIGGRYRNRLILRNGEEADQAMVCDIDKEALQARAIGHRQEHLSLFMSKNGLSTEQEAEQVLAADKRMHDIWGMLKEPRPRGKEYREWLGDMGSDGALALRITTHEFDVSKPNPPPGWTFREWVNNAPWLTAFAVLKDGQWYESGSMGWWGIVSDEKDGKVWEEQFNSLFESLRQDQYITFVDCHI